MNMNIERIHESPSLSGAPPQKLKVSPDGSRVTFIKGKENDFERYDLWEYHIATGKTRVLFDADDLHTGDEALSDEEKARRERMRVYGSGILDYQWSADGKALVFPLGGDIYYFKLGSESAVKLVETEAFETDVKFSPKGNYVSFIRDQNLYVVDLATKKEKAITTEGAGDIKFGMAEFVAQEEMSRMTGYWWSPDESYIALTKVDEAPVMNITRSEIYADSIKMIEQKYPKAGTDNVIIELAVAHLDTDELQWIDLGENKDIYLARVDWKNDNTLTYQVQTRDQKHLALNAYDVAKTKTYTLLTEQSDTWINLHYDIKFLDNGDFIWASERDGYKHLYLIGSDGKVKQQLTKGEWVVESIKGFNKNTHTIFFEGRKDTPLESHLYALNLETSQIERLTEKGFFHNTNFSKDGSIFVKTSSNINTPPQVSLHDANGKQLTWLDHNKVEEGHPLYPYMANWIEPTFGTIKSDDKSTDLYYRLYTPENIDSKRPVIVYLYGGPHAQVVTNAWAGNRGLLFQHWVQKGYVVFSIDNRGSNYRGKAFEEPIYQAMGSIEVTDQVSGVKFLQTLDYVDPERIGVYGHSYGGYMTLMTMFQAGDYFKVGVSGAPVTDWRIYDTHYTERYMGNPNEVDDKYTASSVFPYAKDLTGELLIYHGMADDNVLFSHSTKLYKHLQDLAIPFHTMDYPGKKHSLRGKATGIHMYKTITRFFDQHLENK
ncbi:DPP IV N-terminal domain-containing protein [Glaciecola sp. 1036]|uniref:S9 family peptidase n=1 Tax=Alteromonadaceae TaxID=72275 RepID=UPI003D003A70